MMNEPAEYADNIGYETLFDDEEWVIRQVTAGEHAAIPIWISHYCGEGYSHRYTGFHGDTSWPLNVPCGKCGSVVPEGTVALYLMLISGEQCT